MPSRPSIKMKAAPATLLVQSRTQQKSFLFLLPARRSPCLCRWRGRQVGAGGEEKIGRAQIKKCEQNFSLGWRAPHQSEARCGVNSASGGGAASLVPFKVGSSVVV